MKKLLLLFVCAFILNVVQAQKVEYKDDVISVDGSPVATVVSIKDKESMGLTSTFEVLSMTGEKMIIGAYAGELEQDKNNTMDQFYRVTFLTTNQGGIFPVSKLGAEKSFAKMIGKSGIIVNGALDAKMVQEFIAKKGKTPKVAVVYTLVARDKSWPISLKQDKTIEQVKTIGNFKDITVKDAGKDTYQFMLPSGAVVATVSFTGGNNAQTCEMYTHKDTNKQIVAIPSSDKVDMLASSIDRNQLTLERITKWLVANQYL
ncbi:MAG: hypothetical protein H0X46_06820 [Bacteroidetes bacterium]|nr:hypothetical protein [Bacteroidota bacterium]